MQRLGRRENLLTRQQRGRANGDLQVSRTGRAKSPCEWARGCVVRAQDDVEAAVDEVCFRAMAIPGRIIAQVWAPNARSGRGVVEQFEGQTILAVRKNVATRIGQASLIIHLLRECGGWQKRAGQEKPRGRREEERSCFHVKNSLGFNCKLVESARCCDGGRS